MGQSRTRAEQKKSTPTRIFKRAGYVGLTALVLAGCEGVPAFSFGSLNIDRERGRIVTQEVTLADGLRVRAPFGKCIDTRRTRQAGANATVVIANCSNLGGRADIGAAVFSRLQKLDLSDNECALPDKKTDDSALWL